MDNFYLQVVDQDPAASDWGWGKKKSSSETNWCQKRGENHDPNFKKYMECWVVFFIKCNNVVYYTTF